MVCISNRQSLPTHAGRLRLLREAEAAENRIEIGLRRPNGGADKGGAELSLGRTPARRVPAGPEAHITHALECWTDLMQPSSMISMYYVNERLSFPIGFCT